MKWLALESNPELFNTWSEKLGLDTSVYAFGDCYGLDPELLAMVPQPVKAVLLLFPITASFNEMKKDVNEKIAKEGPGGMEEIIYFKQTIGNACGTFALLHALANSGVPLKDGPLKALFASCVNKTPAERAALIESSPDISRVHEEIASSGQTTTPDLEAEIDLHFVTFVEHHGNLIELDGSKNVGPLNHGPIQVGLLEDTAEIVKKLAELTNSIQFNLITLGSVC